MRRTSAVIPLIVLAAACGGRTVVVTPRARVSPATLAEIRVDPGPRPRDLFWGVGGKRYAPPPKAVYRFKEKDEAGFSVSYDVIDPEGLEWSAKIGPEAQTEVVVSRILWGLGYHQPPIYYLPSWQVAREGEEPITESEARFRPKLPQLDRLEQTWSWADNPFSGSQELKGLLVILLMLNSTDLKDSNNSIYQLVEPWDGARRWYVVRDLGAALGVTGVMFPRRNWVPGFERQPFITRVSGHTIEMGYSGRWQELLAMIAPGDVQWAARQMARLTDAQWRDAFRAADYADAHAARFISRIKEKIADGLALRVDRRVTGDDR
ncbi:MAG: hypothetical protein HY657_16570 [Acidobacteria bacterium]|nr:hypothetical protein [Acidobacteriota bacterium]